MSNFIFHVGVKRKSGRYEWGSGENPFQHEPWFQWRSTYARLTEKGYSSTELVKMMNEELGINMRSTGELRAKNTIYRNEQNAALIAYCRRLREEKKMSHQAIADRIGTSEGKVRDLLKPGAEEKVMIHNSIADSLEKDIATKGFIDVGRGIEATMGISRERLKAATTLLEEKGYEKYKIPQKQSSGETISVIVLGNPDPSKSYDENWRDAYNAVKRGDVFPSNSEDRGRTFKPLEKPVNIDSKRIDIVYGDEGGSDKDGLIEIRRGAKDLNMGDRSYCQARIAVDDKYYLKGMVVYSDDLPPGTDIRFNTNKKSGTPIDEVFKKQDKSSETNPFKASIKQHHYIDEKGNERLSAINIVNDEESFGSWKRSLSSQMLSKQRPAVAERQLKLHRDIREAELRDILRVTNPTIRQKLLVSFADSCDSDAVHLQAAPMPGQKSHVILPSTKMKENEIYAPNYKNGDRVVLIRYPHGGTFEIPELVVNNNNKTAKNMIDRSTSAVVINPKVAKVLSGADFDGDTVLVIPNNKGVIRKEAPLKQLENFDPSSSYPGGKKMGLKEVGIDKKKGQDGFDTQTEMGKISNLITDMTIKGASRDEIARAVRHSMVVIDAEKHQLDHKTSYSDNRIDELKERYQGKKSGGASTIVSRAKSPQTVNQRERRTKIDPETGKVIYTETGKVKRVKTETGEYVDAIDKKGNPILKTQYSTKMMETDDAFSLVQEKGKYQIETAYANHANYMKKLANEARKQSTRIPKQERSPSAAKVYAKEVESLEEKLRTAKANTPLERKAQSLASELTSAAIKEDPAKYQSYEARQKLRGRLISEARDAVGAKKKPPEITNKEWQAIQANAISPTALKELTKHMTDKELKRLATPRQEYSLSPSQINMAKSMYLRGYVQSEIAEMLGVSASTISNAIRS